MESRCLYGLCTISLRCDFLNNGSEHSMGPWTLLVHVCARNVPVFVPFLDQIDHFEFVFNTFLYTALQESLAFVFPDLEFLMTIIEQVIYCLIIDLNIGAFHFKIYLRDVFIRGNCLILKWLACTLWLILKAYTWKCWLSLMQIHYRIADFINLIK